jgi:hypothetical protein
MVAASSGVTNSFSHPQSGQKDDLRFFVLRINTEQLRSIMISVVRFVVRVFIQVPPLIAAVRAQLSACQPEI